MAARSVTDLPVMAAAVAPICDAANPAAKFATVLLMSIRSRPCIRFILTIKAKAEVFFRSEFVETILTDRLKLTTNRQGWH